MFIYYIARHAISTTPPQYVAVMYEHVLHFIKYEKERDSILRHKPVSHTDFTWVLSITTAINSTMSVPQSLLCNRCSSYILNIKSNFLEISNTDTYCQNVLVFHSLSIRLFFTICLLHQYTFEYCGFCHYVMFYVFVCYNEVLFDVHTCTYLCLFMLNSISRCSVIFSYA